MKYWLFSIFIAYLPSSPSSFLIENFQAKANSPGLIEYIVPGIFWNKQDTCPLCRSHVNSGFYHFLPFLSGNDRLLLCIRHHVLQWMSYVSHMLALILIICRSSTPEPLSRKSQLEWLEILTRNKISFFLSYPFLSLLHEIYVYMVLACDCVDARGKCWASSSFLIALKQGYLLNKNLAHLARLAILFKKLLGSVCLPLLPMLVLEV